MTDEQSSRVRLSRRKLLGGLGAIGATGAASGAGSFALFSDSEASTGNTVQAGSIDLTLSDGGGTDQNGVSGSFTLENAKPGQSSSGNISLENAGSLEADHVEIKFEIADATDGDGPTGSDEADTAPDSAAGLAELIKVRSLVYPDTEDGFDLTAEITDANENGITDLDDIVTHGILDGIQPPPANNGGSKGLFVGFEFVDTESDAYEGALTNNDFQGDSIDVEVHFALAQESGQTVL
ncbi:TasA family protein [Halarchaeum sp. P4]|uniref:TasA family protein n=1 Tax=Halarchaeum sp. P4 TaxID=3421639 RepID=UPI003EBFF0E3